LTVGVGNWRARRVAARVASIAELIAASRRSAVFCGTAVFGRLPRPCSHNSLPLRSLHARFSLPGWQMLLPSKLPCSRMMSFAAWFWVSGIGDVSGIAT
jgi:hypothetical protein